MPSDEHNSPTAAAESILLTSAIKAKGERCIMTLDIPKTFLQTSLPKYQSEERVTTK